ncbi:MAG TPA: peptidoglycan-binding protein [Ornithinibacter sp.]|nr:peptidoglycan-binding protein [Ornithinibacter sp.]
MGRTRGMRAGSAAAALTAAAVLLAGCGSLPGSWIPGRATPTAAGSTPSTTASSGWTPAVEATTTPTPSETPSPTPSQTPTSTPSQSATPTPSATRTTKPAPSPSATTKPRTSLIRGDSGPKVLALQRRLTELGYWLGAPDGSFGSLTQQAVWAFQKSAGLRRDGVVGPKTLRALEAGIRPKATIGGSGVEIDLDRQILLVVRGGSVRTILNTSTGSGEEYTSTSGNRAIAVTPRGSYTVYRAVDGPVTNSLGQLWRPRFFHRGIAVHGSGNIPPWPDSHGCARVSNAAIDMIWATDLMPVGSRVVVR